MRRVSRSAGIITFARQLATRLKGSRIPAGVRTESQLERRFLIPLARRLAKQYPGVALYIHPMKQRRRCEPSCQAAHAAGRSELGCPNCWRHSKKWASVAAHGMHHTFDLVARRGTATLVLEAKCLAARRGRMPNGEAQRMLGQCALATARHQYVIGFLVHRGPLKDKWSAHTKRVEKTMRRAGVELVVRQA